MHESFSGSAEKRSYGRSSGQDWAHQVGSHLSRGLFASADVSVDEVTVFWHSGVDARATREAAAPKAHDARLHDALGSTTHQWASIIPLWKHIPHTHTCTHIVYLLAVMTDSRIISKGIKTSLPDLLKIYELITHYYFILHYDNSCNKYLITHERLKCRYERFVFKGISVSNNIPHALI